MRFIRCYFHKKNVSDSNGYDKSCSRLIFTFLFLTLIITSCKQEDRTLRKVTSLYQPKNTNKSGDWLETHKETFYDFETYKNSHPVRPDNKRKIIYVYRLGENTNAEDSLLAITREYLECVFHLQTKLAQTFPLSFIPDSMQRYWSDSSFQVQTHYILNKMAKLPLPEDAVVGICFTKYDLYPGPSWNFVFGQAYLKQRVGVWSFNRYGNVNDPVQFERALARTLKVASHETGHMFSITHCIRYECGMNGSNSLLEMDNSPLHFCPDCLEKLSWNVDFDLEDHFQALVRFYEKYDFKDEAEFMKKNLTRLNMK